jgi:hypothetical protein
VSAPTPRPALKKAADAHVHPAAPGHSPRGLRQAPDSAPEPDAGAKGGVPDANAPGHRLSGPLGGTTSDSLRSSAKGGRRGSRSRSAKPEKSVDLTVRVPKSVRKEFRAAAKDRKMDPNDVVTALLRSWLDN